MDGSLLKMLPSASPVRYLDSQFGSVSHNHRQCPENCIFSYLLSGMSSKQAIIVWITNFVSLGPRTEMETTPASFTG